MLKIKSEDEVIILAGKDKGKRGKVRKILDNNKLVGIVTVTDLLDSICVQDELDGQTVMPLDFKDSRYADKYASARI